MDIHATKVLVGALSSLFIVACSSDEDNNDTMTEIPASTLSDEVRTFEGSFQLWADADSRPINTIDFESISSSRTVPISGNEFISLPGSPTFSTVGEEEIFVGIPDTNQTLTPFSGVNTLYPTCDPSCEGVIKISFAERITRFGLYFIDVEEDFASTGLSLSDFQMPEVPFTSSKGQNTQTFLGLERELPFSSVFIHFATGPRSDGTLVDNVSYSVSE